MVDGERSYEDEAIDKYAEILQKVYTDRTAGSYTFAGILTMFLRDLNAVKPVQTLPNSLLYPPGVRNMSDIPPTARGLGDKPF